MHCIFKDDKNYSMSKGIKTLLKTIEGEKLVEHKGKYIITSFLPPFPSKALMSHIMAVKENENIYTQQALAQRSAPISFYICVTNKCSYNCEHCSAKGRTEGQELSTREWIEVIKDIQDMNTPIIGFTGGEPLERDDIEELVSAVDDRSISILFTNGRLLTMEKAAALKQKGLFGVGVSLDFSSAEEHNQRRQNSTAFESALEALSNAERVGLYTMVNTVVYKNRLDEERLFELFALTRKYGAHEVRILEPILSGKLLNKADAVDIFFSNEDREKLIEIQKKANKRKDFPKVTTFAYTESFQRYGCGAGTQHSYINASGELFPCDFVPLSFGNVKDINIKDLWLEMNKSIGIPKKECFAMSLNSALTDFKLPISKGKSLELCTKCRNNEFPEYYKVMQGKV